MTARSIFLALSSAALLMVFSADLLILKTLLREGLPNFGVVYLFRLTLILLSSLFLVLAISQTGKRLQTDKTSGWSIPDPHFDDSAKRYLSYIPAGNAIAWGILLLSIAFLLVFVYKPGLFHEMQLEDQSIEMLSALFSFTACGIFVYSSILLRKYRPKEKLFIAISLGFAFCFFLITMEEISWFQRFLSYETPTAFSGNIQNEFNIHNFATDPFENVYYFGAFLFLILIPFINENTSLLKRYRSISFFIPGRFIIFASAIFAAYNYDMWNIVFTQIAFFVTLFILVYYLWNSEKTFYLFSLIFIYILTQVIFIAKGDNFEYRWDVTEYKEFFIPLGFLLYSIEVLQKTRRLKTNRNSALP